MSSDKQPEYFYTRTRTLAEFIDGVIAGAIERKAQNGAGYYEKDNLVIGVLDNNQDNDKITTFETFEYLAGQVGIKMKRIIHGKHDWWISMYKVNGPDEALIIMRKLTQ